MSLGRATYLKSKDGGENSMSRKGGRTPYRNGIGPSDLCPMAKARLPEPQSPSVQVATPGRMRLITGSDRFCSGWCVASAARSERSAATRGVLKGMSGEPKGLSGQPSRTTGSPNGREPHGDRALIVVSGRESRLQGEGGQVSEGKDSRRCEMHNNRSRIPPEDTGEPDARKRARPVREGVVGKGVLQDNLAGHLLHPSSGPASCSASGNISTATSPPSRPTRGRRATATAGVSRGTSRATASASATAREFYGWLKDNGHLGLAEEIGNREDFPTKIIHWSPEQIDLATVEILARAGHR